MSLWLSSVVAAAASGAFALRVRGVAGILAPAVGVAAIAAAAAAIGSVTGDLGTALVFAGASAASSTLAKLITRRLDTPSAGDR